MITKRQLQIALKPYQQETKEYYYIHIDDLTRIVNELKARKVEA